MPVVLCADELFLSIAVGDCTVWPGPSLLSCSSPDGHLGCSPYLSLTKPLCTSTDKLMCERESSRVWDPRSRTRFLGRMGVAYSVL